MKLQNIQNQWWYRLLKVVYYSGYIISLIIGFFIFPIVILFYEFIRGVFFYVTIGDWNWQFQKRKNLIKKGVSYIQKPGTSGLGRLPYNLIFFFGVLPGLFLSIGLSLSDFDSDITGGIVMTVIVFLLFLIISFYRFHNIGISGKNIWWIVFPIMNIIYLGKLIFQKEGKKADKHKKESLLVTLILFVIIIGGIIGFHVYQFYSLQNTVESMRSSELGAGLYTKEEFISKIREKYPQYNEISNDELYNGFIEKYPVYESQIISE